MNRNILVAIILFILLGVGAFYLFKINNRITVIQTPTVSGTATPSVPVSTITPSATFLQGLVTLPMRVVDNFYQDYIICLKNPPKSISDTPSAYCVAHNTYGSSQLMRNLRASNSAQLGFEPVICSKAIPQNIQAIGTSPIIKNKTTAIVEESFSTGNPIKINVDVAQEGTDWRMENITCPHS